MCTIYRLVCVIAINKLVQKSKHLECITMSTWHIYTKKYANNLKHNLYSIGLGVMLA